MYGLGVTLWWLTLVLSIPVLAIAVFVRVGLVKKRLDLLRREWDVLRLAPGSCASEEIVARVRRLEEWLDHVRGVLRSGAMSIVHPGPVKSIKVTNGEDPLLGDAILYNSKHGDSQAVNQRTHNRGSY